MANRKKVKWPDRTRRMAHAWRDATGTLHFVSSFDVASHFNESIKRAPNVERMRAKIFVR